MVRTVLLLAVLSSAWLLSSSYSPGPEPKDLGTNTPIVVELFTSEGCSSCPPADRLLAELDVRGESNGRSLITLGEHVDYWNGLGWKDRFSSADLTQRQSDYVRRMRLASAYTPQMVINGRSEFVGNDASILQQKLADAPGLIHELSLEISPDKTVHVRISTAPAQGRLLLLITESNLVTHVKRGENGGKDLVHAAVVRHIADLGTVHPNSAVDVPLKLDQSWKLADLKVVALIQSGPGGAIVGAASARLR